MSKYKPQYPILSPNEMLPRDQIRLDPERELSTFDRAELQNLRGGVGYKIVTGNTPDNRDNIAMKTTYFQMVAYKEGWKFDPELYQVEFIDPKSPVLRAIGGQARIWQFEKGSTPKILGLPIKLSSADNVGFVVRAQSEEVRVMEEEEADGLAKKLKDYFE